MIFFFRRLLSLTGGINVFVVLLLTAQVFFVNTAAAAEGTADSEKIARMERLIKEQQQRMELLIKEQQQRMELLVKEQNQHLEVLQQQVNQLKNTSTESIAEAQEAKSVAEEAKATAQVAVVPVEKVVTSGEERVKLSISGMVNRAVNVVDDGKNTDTYYVDNDNSESRVNFVGTAKIDDDLTLGTRIELTIAPNKASNVDQNTPESGDVFEERWTEVSLASKHFGKLSLGRGFTASYGIASSDLSETTVIATSTIVDLAGGMLFRQKGDDSLTDLRIDHSFSDFNGLSRKNRLRYDSPKFYGAHLAVSAVSDARYDGGLYWGGQGYGFKAAAAAGIANPKEDDADLQYAGSMSVLHEETGLNLSLSAGMKERDNQSDASNFFVKAGWLAKFFSVGKTAFSVDYTHSNNVPTENDDGYSYAVAAVQNFDKYGTELYALYRLYSLDRDVEPEVHDMGVASMGVRVMF
jgi:predicted porin